MARFAGGSEVLVISAWVEERPERPLRARITRIHQKEAERQVAVTSSVEDVLAIVREWLQGIQQGVESWGNGSGPSPG